MESAAVIKPEILAPAGSLEKLKFAVRYGADAVYFGGGMYNLRVRAGNFTEAELEQASDFCRENHVKTVFLMNAFLHEKDLEPAKEYIRQIRSMNFDAVMVSDPGMLLMLQDAGIDCSFHLSTQMNTLNSRAVKFWERTGFSRVVLGREVTLEEIKSIRKSTSMEIEIFAHGALCVAYSGRCLLSRYLTGRDANQGDCTQPCRWNYRLVEEKRPGIFLGIDESSGGTEIISSKDLCLLERLSEYIEAGVDSFKIEGRIKSVYHAANTTRIYADAARLAGTPEFEKRMPFWKRELDLVSHRPYTDDLFNEFKDQESFSGVPYINKALFMGYKAATGQDLRHAEIKTANPVYTGDVLEGIFPISDKIQDGRFTVEKITDSTGAEIPMARPNTVCTIRFDRDVDDWAVFRKITDQQEKEQ